MRARVQWLMRAALLLLGFYAIALGLVYFGQERLLFSPEVLPAGHRFDLPDVQEVSVPVAGATLNALHFKQSNARGVVFFLHGNGGSLRSWLTSTEFYRRTGYDLFMLDYRGFGKSSGSITSEAQLHADVRAAWRLIEPQYAGRRKVIYGRSLGTGLAAHLAREVRADLLVLVSPYFSIADLAATYYPWVPLALLRYPLRTDQVLPHINMPILIMHGADDELIPYAHAERLRERAAHAELIRVQGARHNDIHRFAQYLDPLAARLVGLGASVLERPAPR
jgi:hypothetical protein